MPLARSLIVILLFAGLLPGFAPVSAAKAHEFAKSPTFEKRLGIGHTPTEELINAWNIDIAPDGSNLPDGSGSVAQVRQIYADTCAACHGEHGTEGPMDRLAGGEGTLTTKSRS